VAPDSSVDPTEAEDRTASGVVPVSRSGSGIEPLAGPSHFRDDRSYTAALGSDLQKGMNDTAGGHTLPLADSTKFWSDFSGSMFLLATVLSLALEVVLWIVMGFSLGAAFLVGIVVSIALTAAMKTLSEESGPFSDQAYAHDSPLSPALVWVATSQLNSSSLGPGLDQNSAYLPAMIVSSDLISDLLSGSSLAVALFSAVALGADGAAYLGILLGIVGIFASIAAHVWDVFDWGLVVILADIESVACDFTSLGQEGGTEGPTEVVNGLTFLLDAGSLVLDFEGALAA
jgi:hypothetical protein